VRVRSRVSPPPPRTHARAAAPFFFEHRGSPGSVVERGAARWRGGFVLALLEHALKTSMKGVIGIVEAFRLMPKIMGTNVSRIWVGEPFSPTGVTIYPRLRFVDFYRIAQDPDERIMREYLHIGATMTFPKLGVVSDRFRVERALDEAVADARRAVVVATVAGELERRVVRSEA